MKTIYVKMYDPIEILPAVLINSETVKKYCVKVYRYDTER